METESHSEASTVVNKIEDIHLCLQDLNQKVNSVVGLHKSIEEMAKKYDEVRSAGEAMEELHKQLELQLQGTIDKTAV